MVLVTDLATPKTVYIINFDSFSTYFLLTIVSKVFAQLINISGLMPQNEKARNIWVDAFMLLYGLKPLCMVELMLPCMYVCNAMDIQKKVVGFDPLE